MNAAVLPKQVQAQLEEAERLQQSLTQAEPASDSGPPDPGEEPQPAEASPGQPQPATPAEPPEEPARDAAYWKKRFETVDGMYKADVQPLRQQLQTQAESLAQLQARLEAQQQAQQKPEEPKKAQLVTAQDEERYGSDLIELMRRVIREESGSVVSRMDAFDRALASLGPHMQRVGKVEQEVALTRQERFWGELTKEVPDWEQINADERWLAWLTKTDQLSGRTRQTALQEAQAALDFQRVIAIFKLFKETLPAVQPTQPRNDLARQVAPSKSSKAGVPPQGAKVYTADEYAYWLDPRRANDVEKPVREQMLVEMDRAFAEGRVRW